MNRVLLFLLAASLFINALLLFRGATPLPLHLKAADEGKAASVSSVVAKEPVFSSDLQGAIDSNKTPKPMNWREIESADYKEYVRKLREVGCPEETVKDIVASDLRKQFEVQRLAVLRTSLETNYWSSTFNGGSTLLETNLHALHELHETFNWSYKELLGYNPDQNHNLDKLDSEDMETLSKYGMLDPETLPKVRQLLGDLKAASSWLPPNDERQTQLFIEADERIKSLMSLEERTRYDMYYSDIAKSLREVAASVPLSESEFQAAFAIANQNRIEPDIKVRATEAVSQVVPDVRFRRR